MDIQYAKELLRVLADGVNPLTGEVLPSDDSSNQVEIVRAIHTVLEELDSPHIKTKKNQPANAGKPWTNEDDTALCKMYDENWSSKSMREHFKRSKWSITARLIKLGKIKDLQQLK